MKKATSTMFMLLVTCFVASATLSSITSPPPQSTVVSNPHPTFCWTPSGGDAYGYYLGFSAMPAQRNPSNGQYYGGSELGSFAVAGTCFTIPYDLPVPAGGIMYVTLAYYENATPGPNSQPQSQKWYPYPWVATAAISTLVSPTPNSQLAAATTTWQFTQPTYMPLALAITSPGAAFGNLYANANIPGLSASVTLPTADTFPAGTILTAVLFSKGMDGGWDYAKVYSFLPPAPAAAAITQGFTPPPAPLDDYPTAVSSSAEARTMSTTRTIQTAKGPLTFKRADLFDPGDVGYDQPFKDGDFWTYGFHFDAAEVALAVLGGPYEDDLKLGRVASTQPPGWSAATKGWMPQVLRPETITRDKRTQFGYTSSRLPGVIPLNLASSAISEPMELYEGMSFEDLNRITSAASIASNSQHRFVIGPAIKPGATAEEVKALGKRWADDYGFAFLKPWLDGGTLADLSPQNDLERDIVTCLKRVE